MKYYAVVRSKPNTELTHFKYTKREKVNGKWVYTYPEDLKGIPEKLDSTVRTPKEAVEAVSEKSGMYESAIAEARLIGETLGYDSPEYKEKIYGLAEGDEEWAKEYTKILKSAKAKNTITKNTKKTLKDISNPVTKKTGESAVTDAIFGRAYAKRTGKENFAVKTMHDRTPSKRR